MIGNKLLNNQKNVKNELSFGLLSAALQADLNKKIVEDKKQDLIDDFNSKVDKKGVKFEAGGIEQDKPKPIKQDKLASAWSHNYKPALKSDDTYKFGKNLEGITKKYADVLTQMRNSGGKFTDKDFPAVWESIRGNGNMDKRM